ncbi:PDDEXK nuclease domain-containing protein [Fusobacterium perfoetens]|uniref:PDDEXK nuclease domain-containing protein n=1 Tax=Fusobacterium perfoetens TaxID=852 RepID=UPI001F39642D|nr:PDDEXK nuclease domain-containing protein [Fusobacterium perfoetens]MCF2612738.1 DUF1016 family protein [Fusobacterium perfoetens]
MDIEIKKDVYTEISNLLKEARKSIVSNINTTMTKTYFLIGKRIVEEEQNGNERAVYGENLIKTLSKRLTEEFGKGFSVTNLKQMKSFYIAYKKGQTVSDQFKLSWSHYLILMRMENIEERNFYEIESIQNNWSLRELRRQIDSALYERLVLSRDKEKVKELAFKGQVIEKPEDVVKDPYILEFLGFEEQSNYSENKLETEIINNLEKFLLELGKGFTFVGRQVRFTFDEKHFRVDLVFYNRILKCFVLIDLKIGEVTHQDLGQMQMYVNYYDRYVRLPDENKSIGIIICREKNDTLVKLTLPEDNNQIFASKYMTVLPTKEEFKKILDKNLDN